MVQQKRIGQIIIGIITIYATYKILKQKPKNKDTKNTQKDLIPIPQTIKKATKNKGKILAEAKKIKKQLKAIKANFEERYDDLKTEIEKAKEVKL